ncbi:MAG: TrmJ/YjtD family RNA methyltransferase [Promethearchaeota archaeon]|nr:MAG: TrmJ/YjtD family RNA methyltransferase [Candidatus Lokiarchaeota archaeon]
MNKKKKKKVINSFQETHRAHQYENLSLTIILVQPEQAANIGSIARIMENFNFRELIIFNPLESVGNILSYKTQGFAMHGKEILFNAEIIEINNQENHLLEFRNFIKNFDYVIATTAKGKRYSNIRRLAVFPEDLNLPISDNPLKIALLFGKESRGLTNEEISLADILLRIPTSNQYSALNLSHACGIILYEIFKKINVLNIGRGENPVLIADQEDRLILYDIIKKIIEKLKIRSYKKENMFFAFKNIFGRSFISKKELSLVLGLFSKVNKILERLNIYQK